MWPPSSRSETTVFLKTGLLKSTTLYHVCGFWCFDMVLRTPLLRDSGRRLQLIGEKAPRIREHRYYRVSLDDVWAAWWLELYLGGVHECNPGWKILPTRMVHYSNNNRASSSCANNVISNTHGRLSLVNDLMVLRYYSEASNDYTMRPPNFSVLRVS